MRGRFSLLPSFVVSAALLLVSCGPLGTIIQPTFETVKSYEIGETMEANTGSAVVSGGRVQTLPAFSPVRTITPPGRAVNENDPPKLTPDQRWIATRKLEGDGYLIIPPESYPPPVKSLAINADGSVRENGWLDGKQGRSVSRDNGEWPDGQVFEKVEPVPQEGSFEFEILYSGKDGQTVNMTYREYIDGMQRADFSQNLSYNIAEQDTISFRSIQMHVKEANSSYIRYEVIEDGGLPWLPR